MRFRSIRTIIGTSRRNRSHEIEPDEIFLDASNLPDFDESQFEGRFERPFPKFTLVALSVVFALIASIGIGKVWTLQVNNGSIFAAISESNRLRHSIIFPKRGVIYDRNGTPLAWNEQASGANDFPSRRYAELSGVAHVVGYVNYPQKDRSGVYFQDTYLGRDGVELALNDLFGGINGLKIVETNAIGEVQSESVIEPPIDGKNLTLSIDARLSAELYKNISDTVTERGFKAGAGVVMDVQTGEIIALVSFPEYRSEILAEGKNTELIARYITDDQKPFLNRIVSGLYAPGSVVKPFVAIGALDQHVIDPSTIIVSTGSIKVPNPYVPGQYSVFNDWKAHGPVDMRRAIAYSSDVYFYEIGGGFENQRGLGIQNIAKYMKLFGIGEATGVDLPGEAEGTVPTPAWKARNFTDATWRIGDTYHTAIGQYGFQVTPLEMVRGIAAIANGGSLVTPTVVMGKVASTTAIAISPDYFSVVQEGMRMAVEEGTASALSLRGVRIAAKTGTAELGSQKQYVNSWITGFFPYESPRYAFTIVMERGPSHNLVGAPYVARQFFDWLTVNAPEYSAKASSTPNH